LPYSQNAPDMVGRTNWNASATAAVDTISASVSENPAIHAVVGRPTFFAQL